MKAIGFGVAVVVAVFGVKAFAAAGVIEELPTAAVETENPVLARASASELDGDDYAVDELLKIATTEDEEFRIAAVEVLGEMASVRSRAVLGVILHSNPMATVRAAAADQLGNLGDGESLFALALALETEPDAEVRDVIQANIERNLPVEPAPEETPRLPGVAMLHAG